MKKKREGKIFFLIKALGGGLLAGVGLLNFGMFFMPLAIAFLWSLSANPFAGFLWGFTAVLFSHKWLLALHPISWIGVTPLMSFFITTIIWFSCGCLGGLLTGFWCLLGQTLLSIKPLENTFRTSLLWAVVMSSAWGLAEVQLSQMPLFWIGISSSMLPEDKWIAGLARWIGAGGLTTIQFLIGWWVFQTFTAIKRGGSWGRLFFVGCISIFFLHLGGWSLLINENLSKPNSLAIWQPVIPIREKFSENNLKNLPGNIQKALKKAESLGATWMVAPEGTLPVGQDLDFPAPIPLLSGGFRAVDGTQRSSLLLFESGETSFTKAIDKFRLVPLGEWVPSISLFFNGLSAVGGIQPGDSSRFFDWNGPSIAVAICYEISDGRALSKAINKGSEWILTIANLDPCPQSLQKQFLSQAQLRSIETGRDLVSAANTGPSAIVSSYGTIRPVVPPFEEGIGLANIHFYKQITAYVRWGESSLILLFSLSLLGLSRQKPSSFSSKRANYSR